MGANNSRKKRSSFDEESHSSSAIPKSRTSSDSSHSDPNVFSPTRCASWFDKYKEENEDQIGPDGVERFCEELGVSPDNVVILVIAWKMNAQTMGYFTREEWMHGMKKMNCDTMAKLKGQEQKLVEELKDPSAFKEAYRYAFDFSKEKGQKSMDIATAQAMILLLMKDKPHVAPFIQFLEDKKPIKVMNKDQWMSFLEFCDSIALDLSNYDEMSAWPVLLDDYVNWKRQNS